MYTNHGFKLGNRAKQYAFNKFYEACIEKGKEFAKAEAEADKAKLESVNKKYAKQLKQIDAMNEKIEAIRRTIRETVDKEFVVRCNDAHWRDAKPMPSKLVYAQEKHYYYETYAREKYGNIMKEFYEALLLGDTKLVDLLNTYLKKLEV